jgi:Kef-type K+ transport system membrane component KefB
VNLPFELSMLTKFAIAMAMALLLPRVMERLRLPGVLGFIVAGVILGPGLSNVITGKGEATILFAELGKLLFMFFVGFEVDSDEFRKARTRALLFGTLTFSLPFAGGLCLGRLSGYSWPAAVLIGSVIASHTLLAHSILARLKLLDRDAVLVTIGGTIITDVAAMLVLAVAVSVHRVGFSRSFLAIEVVELALFVPPITLGLGRLARKLIIRFGQSAEALVIILLVLIAVAGELAQLINLEGIVGAFLAGIAVKRAVRGKFVVEQLEVVSNSLFIPAFFLTTGFLVDFRLLGATLISRPGIVVGLFAALVVGKYLAAWLTARACRYTPTDGKLIFSLSLPQMAATLASAVVGYQAINSKRRSPPGRRVCVRRVGSGSGHVRDRPHSD